MPKKFGSGAENQNNGNMHGERICVRLGGQEEKTSQVIEMKEIMPHLKTDIQFAANIIHMLARHLAGFLPNFYSVFACVSLCVSACVVNAHTVFACDFGVTGFGSIDLFGAIRKTLFCVDIL